MDMHTQRGLVGGGNQIGTGVTERDTLTTRLSASLDVLANCHDLMERIDAALIGLQPTSVNAESHALSAARAALRTFGVRLSLIALGREGRLFLTPDLGEYAMVCDAVGGGSDDKDEIVMFVESFRRAHPPKGDAA